MPFRLRRDTRTWFRDIENAFSLDFDMYHLCLLAGLAAGRKTSIPDDETTVLVETFPGEYRTTGRLIIAFFLSVELEQLGILKSDRAALDSTINSLVDPQAPSQLSPEGLRAMNQYCYAGFDIISEWFDSRPHTFDAFIPEYTEHLTRAMGKMDSKPL